jgi:GTP-binding protein YchF
MKLGLIGLPGAGKTTLFEALTKSQLDASQRREVRIGTVRVPDERVDRLAAMYQPRKTIYAQVEYLLPAPAEHVKESGREQSIWTQVRDCDALLHVVRNFSGYGGEPATPKAAFQALDQELILSDLMVAEKRLERLELDQRRGKKPDPEEIALVRQCAEHLNQEIPLRRFPQLTAAKQLRGYAFLSAKPCLVLFNNSDEDADLPAAADWVAQETCLAIRGKLEQELGQMSPDEAGEFMAEFDIRDLAMDRVIHGSYALLGLISFFTVGEDEVRAWTIARQTAAVDAAEVIHSDIKKGFIRAEVLAYDDLMAAGSYAEARKQGTVRLEGKTYEVKDGDIINFRFNV